MKRIKHIVIEDGMMRIDVSGFNHDREASLEAKLGAVRNELAKRDRSLDEAMHKLEVIAESASDYYDQVQVLKAEKAELLLRLGEG